MGKNRQKLDFGDPKRQVSQLVDTHAKFSFGEKGYTLYDIKKLKPRFAFDYISLNGKDRCFNSTQLTTQDFHGLLGGLKKISDKTYEELLLNKYYRFHKVDLKKDDITISHADFVKALGQDNLNTNNYSDLPTLYQFDLHYDIARAFGFLFKGTFYLIWFDKNHDIYKRT